MPVVDGFASTLVGLFRPLRAYWPIGLRIEYDFRNCLRHMAGEVEDRQLTGNVTPNLFLIIGGERVATIEGWSLRHPFLFINHFALEKEYLEKGYGRRLIHGIRRMAKVYKVEQIVFTERAVREHPRLFASKTVKAPRLHKRRNSRRREDELEEADVWLWDIRGNRKLDHDKLLESNKALKRALRAILSTKQGRSVYKDAISELQGAVKKLNDADGQELCQHEAELDDARAVLTLLLRDK